EPTVAGRGADAVAGLQPGPSLSRRPARPDRSAGRRLHRPPGRSGAQSVTGHPSAAAGARLLDAREVASGSRGILVARLLPGRRTAERAAENAPGLACPRIPSHDGDDPPVSVARRGD